MTCNYTDFFGKPQKLVVYNRLDLGAGFLCDEEFVCISKTVENMQFWTYKDFTGNGCEIKFEGPCGLRVLFGSDDPRLYTLRRFRDEVLIQNSIGQEIIELYYEWSPVIVKAIEADEEFKEEVKEIIDGILLLIGEEVE